MSLLKRFGSPLMRSLDVQSFVCALSANRATNNGNVREGQRLMNLYRIWPLPAGSVVRNALDTVLALPSAKKGPR